MTIESTEHQLPTTPAITYSEGYAQVFLGDCLELYKNIEPKSIDLILTDLPYGTTACKWDTIIPFEKLWEMVNYLLKPNGAFITTASQPFTSALVMSNPKMFRHSWIWEKTRPANFMNAKFQPMKYHEDVLIFGKNKVIYNPIKFVGSKNHASKERSGKSNIYNMKENKCGIDTNSLKYPSSVIKIKSTDSTQNYHPTQKPLLLMEYLLKTYSNEGMTIFDPCMGSGTTGVACKNLNRNFIGIEKDEGYFKIAEQRINARTLFS